MRRRLIPLAGIAALLASAAGEARLTRFIVTERSAAPARPDWVILRGYYEGEVDPTDAHNRGITDVALAARLPNGRVGYSATFAIAMPRDLRASSGLLLYDVPNRGNGDVAVDAQGHITASPTLKPTWQSCPEEDVVAEPAAATGRCGPLHQ